MKPRYCIDTSSLVHAGVRAYPRTSFPSVWKNLEKLIDGNHIISPDEVLRELKRQDDDIFKWAKARPSMFLPLEQKLQNVVTTILRDFPKLVDTTKGRSGGDPWVIGLAQITNCVVVSQEFSKPSNPRIPDVCKHYGIGCITILELIQREGWKF